MTINSGYTISPFFNGDVDFAQDFSSAENDDSPGTIQLVDLVTGPNTITIPSSPSGVLSFGVVIIPPVDNAVVLLLKKVTGDAGITINPAQPMFLSFNDETSFVINAASDVAGIRLIFV